MTTTATTPTGPKTSTITLHAKDGSIMYIVAERKNDGARTFVQTIDSSKKSTRGMTEAFASMDEAKANIAALAAKAAPLGWTRKTAGRGFVAKPDAFASLPAAPGTAPAPTAPTKVKK